MISQKTSRGRLWAARVRWIPPKNVEAFHYREEVGKASNGRSNDSSWQNESPYKEELELLREGSDQPLGGSLMCQAFKAEKEGDWAEFFE